MQRRSKSGQLTALQPQLLHTADISESGDDEMKEAPPLPRPHRKAARRAARRAMSGCAPPLPPELAAPAPPPLPPQEPAAAPPLPPEDGADKEAQPRWTQGTEDYIRTNCVLPDNPAAAAKVVQMYCVVVVFHEEWCSGRHRTKRAAQQATVDIMNQQGATMGRSTVQRYVNQFNDQKGVLFRKKGSGTNNEILTDEMREEIIKWKKSYKNKVTYRALETFVQTKFGVGSLGTVANWVKCKQFRRRRQRRRPMLTDEIMAKRVAFAKEMLPIICDINVITIAMDEKLFVSYAPSTELLAPGEEPTPLPATSTLRSQTGIMMIVATCDPCEQCPDGLVHHEPMMIEREAKRSDKRTGLKAGDTIQEQHYFNGDDWAHLFITTFVPIFRAMFKGKTVVYVQLDKASPHVGERNLERIEEAINADLAAGNVRIILKAQSSNSPDFNPNDVGIFAHLDRMVRLQRIVAQPREALRRGLQEEAVKRQKKKADAAKAAKTTAAAAAGEDDDSSGSQHDDPTGDDDMCAICAECRRDIPAEDMTDTAVVCCICDLVWHDDCLDGFVGTDAHTELLHWRQRLANGFEDENDQVSSWLCSEMCELIFLAERDTLADHDNNPRYFIERDIGKNSVRALLAAFRVVWYRRRKPDVIRCAFETTRVYMRRAIAADGRNDYDRHWRAQLLKYAAPAKPARRGGRIKGAPTKASLVYDEAKPLLTEKTPRLYVGSLDSHVGVGSGSAISAAAKETEMMVEHTLLLKQPEWQPGDSDDSGSDDSASAASAAATTTTTRKKRTKKRQIAREAKSPARKQSTRTRGLPMRYKDGAASDAEDS